MKDGMISPVEKEDAIPIEKLLIDRLLGTPKVDKEVCYYSIPADPIDAQMDAIWHKGVYSGILTQLGYTPKPIIEGHCVVFAELDEDDFTGIGISCGGGMFNVCVSYKTMPALYFSTTRGGDWIDRNVARVLGIKASRATAIKEKGCDLRNPRTNEERAIDVYYRELIRYTLGGIKQRFETASDVPSFPDPVDIVECFRKPEEMVPIARDAVAIHARVLWMQLGIRDLDAAKIANDAGLEVVMDRCVKIEHARILGGLNWAGVNTGVISARRSG